ncbi:MAG: hypothetical protein R2734_04720 [Nocardioides sp.]
MSDRPELTTPGLADKYDRLMQLADLFDATGSELRARSRLGAEILADEDVAHSAELARRTWTRAYDDLRAATSGKHGLMTRSVELDADALVVRATVLTYRWIDELQEAAYKTLGAIAGRALGYLAPQVALGGAIVSAGLIETDAMDRDGVAAYLNDLAENNPDLMDHLTSGGGGLLESLQMRSLLTASALADDDAAAAGRGGLRAVGATRLEPGLGPAVRDVAGALERPSAVVAAAAVGSSAPPTLESLLSALGRVSRPVAVERVAQGRYVVYLRGPHVGAGRLRLVGSDLAAYATEVVAAVERAVADDPDPRVMLVGSGQGGVVAAQLAAAYDGTAFTIDQVVTAGAPAAQAPRIPERCRVLALEDRSDPVALLGSLVNASAPHRVTVVFDGGGTGAEAYARGGRAADQAADRATSPELRAELLPPARPWLPLLLIRQKFAPIRQNLADPAEPRRSGRSSGRSGRSSRRSGRTSPRGGGVRPVARAGCPRERVDRAVRGPLSRPAARQRGRPGCPVYAGRPPDLPRQLRCARAVDRLPYDAVLRARHACLADPTHL